MAALRSLYWGQSITVTGLLTGQDILASLQDQDLGSGILLPTLMLKQGDSRLLSESYFLDDMSVDELSRQLHCPIWPVEDIQALIQTCIDPRVVS